MAHVARGGNLDKNEDVPGEEEGPPVCVEERDRESALVGFGCEGLEFALKVEISVLHENTK